MRNARPTRATRPPTRRATMIAAAVTAVAMIFGGSAPATAAPTAALINGGFEAGAEGWQFVAGSGIATNNPRTGTRLAYLDAGAANQLVQPVTVDQTGSFTAEAWVASSRTGGVFGLRTTAGDILSSIDLPQQSAYRHYVLPPVGIAAGTTVEVFFRGGGGWTNIDDVAFAADERTLFGFEAARQQGPSAIDQASRTITFQVPYDTDVTALRAQAELPEGSTISPDPAAPGDYSQPRSFVVTDAGGQTAEWTVTVTIEAETVTIDSSSQELVDAFDWAKWRARQHVQTGKTGPLNGNGSNPGTGTAAYIPSYWAGYAHRTAFYSRDFVHQAAGGHLLGLEEENKSMLRAFAASANEARKWYPLWALNFDGSPYNVDYRSDTNFVREVPAVFELVQEAEEQYRWTGDADYLDDPVLWQYYTKAVTDFIELHDTQLPNGIAEGTGRGIFQGAASYNERADHAVIEAGDGVASQYRALLAYAYLSAEKGDAATAAEFEQRADALQKYFATDWGVIRDAWEYVRGRGPAGEAYAGFGRENSVFYGVKEFLDAGDKRTWDFIDYLDRMYQEDRPPNIEATTYVPDALFAYGRDDAAWAWMKDIISKLHLPHEVRTQGSNGDYPETSYTLVSQTVEGLAGVRPNAPENAVSVRSHLPSGVDWLALDHIQVGDHDIAVRHDGRTRTTVRHNEGSAPLAVTVQFAGGWPQIKVDGEPKKPEYVHVNGRAVSQVTVEVPVGRSVSFATGGEDHPQRHGDLILTHPQDFTLQSPAEAATRIDAARVQFIWSASENAKRYRLQVARDAAMTDVVAERTVADTEASVTGLEPGRTYYWEVTAQNPKTGQRLVVPGGERTFRTMPSTPPAEPTGVGAYRVGELVGVTWTLPDGAVSATVERAPAGGEDFAVIAAEITGTSYLDRDAGGGPYRYRVSASNEAGAGASVIVEEQAAPGDGPTVHLSDREWVSATSGWRTVLKDKAVSGNPIRVGGVEYAKGIGTHANSEIVYDLDPADMRFSAVIGVDDAQKNSPNSSVVFQVLADGVVMFDSGIVRAQPATPPQTVVLDVLGVERLVLRVTDAGDTNNSDHADWADAKVTRLPGS
ncbi:NPCBM/NEW2 domain-containing protein [Microbacterium cremeum]|uniref:NPCBM/NEW2 domain-containing protein n=1 Tax=Microbacterium cremeum TaxID=2782169 RepID=UPI001888D62D|nr:NPCBM/NEW2 domain-containing protein [Microbacterium cremeum]